MSNLQIIEALCKLVESMAAIIRYLVAELEQQRSLTDMERGAVQSMEDQYSSILGSNELPD